jgi:hypothetical protein
MELLHHGTVHNFSYGRIVYAYTLPGYYDDFLPVTKHDVERIPYLDWEPVAYLGSSGYTFIQAEDIFVKQPDSKVEREKLGSGGEILTWRPEQTNDELVFRINQPDEGNYTIGITVVHMPAGGKISIHLNGKALKFDGDHKIDLFDPHRKLLRNHFSEISSLSAGKNDLRIMYEGPDSEKIVGIDFFWFRENKRK